MITGDQKTSTTTTTKMQKKKKNQRGKLTLLENKDTRPDMYREENITNMFEL